MGGGGGGGESGEGGGEGGGKQVHGLDEDRKDSGQMFQNVQGSRLAS